ncbi:hypothetical protein Esti_006734 [Eimeria stiedai]
MTVPPAACQQPHVNHTEWRQQQQQLLLLQQEQQGTYKARNDAMEGRALLVREELRSHHQQQQQQQLEEALPLAAATPCAASAAAAATTCLEYKPARVSLAHSDVQEDERVWEEGPPAPQAPRLPGGPPHPLLEVPMRDSEKKGLELLVLLLQLKVTRSSLSGFLCFYLCRMSRRDGGAPAKGKRGTVAEKKVKKAQAVSKGLKKPSRSSTAKARYNIRFFRPKTLRRARSPKAPRVSRLWTANPIPAINRKDKYRVLQQPLTTESAMKKIEETNTLVFLCDPRASKRRIKEAVKQTYDVTAQKVNTLIRMDGKKKAYVRLTPDFDALDVANKIGII